jgi:hypothetical protein
MLGRIAGGYNKQRSHVELRIYTTGRAGVLSYLRSVGISSVRIAGRRVADSRSARATRLGRRGEFGIERAASTSWSSSVSAFTLAPTVRRSDGAILTQPKKRERKGKCESHVVSSAAGVHIRKEDAFSQPPKTHRTSHRRESSSILRNCRALTKVRHLPSVFSRSRRLLASFTRRYRSSSWIRLFRVRRGWSEATLPDALACDALSGVRGIGDSSFLFKGNASRTRWRASNGAPWSRSAGAAFEGGGKGRGRTSVLCCGDVGRRRLGAWLFSARRRRWSRTRSRHRCTQASRSERPRIASNLFDAARRSKRRRS